MIEVTGLGATQGTGAPTAARKRVAGSAWGIVGAGLIGGFLLGALIGGGFTGGLDDLSDIIEILVSGPTAVLGAFAFAYLMGRRVSIPALVRWGLPVVSVAGSFLLGFAGGPELAEEGRDDLGRWLGSTEGMIGLVLLGLALLTATGVSMRTFARSRDAPPEPTLEQELFGS